MKHIIIICISLICIELNFTLINIYAHIYPIHKNNERVQYKFILPDYNLSHQQWISGWAMTTERGKPQLPQTGFLFQCNEQTPITITIIDMKQTHCSLHDIPPAPSMINERFVHIKDNQTYETNQFYPSHIFQTDPLSKWSGTNVVRILIRPFQWNPVTQELKIIHQVTFSINCAQKKTPDLKHHNYHFLDPIKSQMIMNYSPQKLSLPGLKKQSKTSQKQKLNIFIQANALYRISYSDLEKHQFPLSQKPASYLQLWHIGQQIPLIINTKSSYLKKDDSIDFYGQSIDNHYTNINVYQLFWGDSPGLRMSVRDASPSQNTYATYGWHTVDFENNYAEHFWPATPGAPEADFIFWDLLVAPDTFSTTFNLPGINLLATNIPTQLSIVFQEKTNSFHDIQIWINDHDVYQNQFHANSLFHVCIPLPTDILRSQNNTLIIQTKLSSGFWADKLFVNRFSLRYPSSLVAKNNLAIVETDQFSQNIEISGFTSMPTRIIDISTPKVPELLISTIITQTHETYQINFFNNQSSRILICTDSTILTPEIQWSRSEQLYSTENDASYIILTPQKFVPAVKPLLDYYTGLGISTMVVSPDTIYDTFNGGIVHPKAVQTFLNYAFHQWKNPPAYILLVGDSNIDYLDFFQTGKQNEVPIYLSYMEGVGLTPNDHYLVCIDGDDLYPDIIIGRLPGKKVSDIEKMVLKRLNYSKGLNTTRQRNLFISDNDSENIFSKICQNAMKYLSFRMEQVHLALTDPEKINILTDQMFDYLNHGALIATYMGHGSIDNWAGEPILHADDIHFIHSDTPLTFYVSLNCLSGYFALPDRYSLSQKLMLAENKAAIAVLAPTAMAQLWEVDILAQALFSLIRSNPKLPVGDLIIGAKMASYAKGIRPSTVQMFTLTGDPLVRLNIPQWQKTGDFDTDGQLTLKDILIVLKYLSNVNGL
jgi:hypothetical protein